MTYGWGAQNETDHSKTTKRLKGLLSRTASCVMNILPRLASQWAPGIPKYICTNAPVLPTDRPYRGGPCVGDGGGGFVLIRHDHNIASLLSVFSEKSCRKDMKADLCVQMHQVLSCTMVLCGVSILSGSPQEAQAA